MGFVHHDFLIDTETSRRAIEKAFGQAVQGRRKELGLSQAELAFRVGIHPTYVSQLERGLKSPTLSVIDRIATALGVSIGELVSQSISQISPLKDGKKEGCP